MKSKNEHRDKFGAYLRLNLDRNVEGGKFAKRFAKGIDKADCSQLKDEKIGHDYVKKCVKNPDMNTATVSAAILAWGGMHYSSRDALNKMESDSWLQICQSLRCGEIDCIKAYKKFMCLRKNGDLKGMGPAYFTKLIYFFQFSCSSKCPRGYIMDQWASETVNLLTGTDTVLLDTNVANKWMITKPGKQVLSVSSKVSDLNTSENYLKFCNVLDGFVCEPNTDRPKIDRAVWGVGGVEGNEDTDWRTYLVAQREKALIG